MRASGVILCLAMAGLPVLLQAAPAHKPLHKPAVTHKPAKKPAAAKTPAAKKPEPAVAKAYAALPPADILGIQSDLAWLSDYEGPPGGDVDQRLIDAVKLFQKAGGGKETGILNEQERTRLAAVVASPQASAGWRLIDDPATGARFGLPEKIVAPAAAARLGGRWVSGRGQIQIETFRLREAGLPALFDEEKKTPRDRRAESSVLKPDSFVITGTQGLKNFVVRAEANGGEVRGITILYDQATAGIMGPVSIAMANSFQGFPDPAAPPPAGLQRAVAYGTAIVADASGDLIAAREAVSACATITVAGLGHAERIAEDPSNDLALIRVYGARHLVPAHLSGETAASGGLTLVGIADPLAQGGGDAVTTASARLDGRSVEPVPKLGFSGAAALDAQGHFAGMIALQAPSVASAGSAAFQAVLVPADAVRAFLGAHGITPATGYGAMEQSVVRIICVRK